MLPARLSIARACGVLLKADFNSGDPKLQPGSRFYCHEPWSIDVVSLFYDKTWWKREFGVQPPGFFGSMTGTIWSPDMGFPLKLDPAKVRPA